MQSTSFIVSFRRYVHFARVKAATFSYSGVFPHTGLNAEVSTFLRTAHAAFLV